MDEFLAWRAYIVKRGSLNVGLRIEGGIAILAAQINRALGGKASARDFAPHLGSDEPISLAQAMKEWD